MTIEVAKSIHRKVWKCFNYVSDERQYNVPEHWTSHAKEVNEGKLFSDDCDGFAFTCCELLIESGVDRSNILFIVCETETGEGHAVCGFTDGETTWILENRYDHVYDWNKRSGYKWFYFMNFATPGTWHKITNGQQ